MVETGSELTSAVVVEAGIQKYLVGEGNFLVGLAGGLDPSLKLGQQLRGPPISSPLLGLQPFTGLQRSDHTRL